MRTGGKGTAQASQSRVGVRVLHALLGLRKTTREPEKEAFKEDSIKGDLAGSMLVFQSVDGVVEGLVLPTSGAQNLCCRS